MGFRYGDVGSAKKSCKICGAYMMQEYSKDDYLKVHDINVFSICCDCYYEKLKYDFDKKISQLREDYKRIAPKGA